jgi:hypothetical protein
MFQTSARGNEAREDVQLRGIEFAVEHGRQFNLRDSLEGIGAFIVHGIRLMG